MRPGGSRPSPTLRDIAIALLGVLVLMVFWIAVAFFVPGPLALVLFLLSMPAYLIWLAWSDARGKPKEGHCPACGYDRTGLPQTPTGPAPCPECGKST